MSDSAKRFFDAWMAQVDLRNLVLDYYCEQLGVDDLSAIPMVSEEEFMAHKSGGPICATDRCGNLLYEESPFIYRFKS